MKRLISISISIFIFLTVVNAQDLKKGYKELKKGNRYLAMSTFKKLKPSNSASEYGIASIYFGRYLYQYKKNKGNKYGDDGTTELLLAFEHIFKADSLVPFTDMEILKKIEKQYSDDKVNELKNKVLDNCLQLTRRSFQGVFRKLNEDYHNTFVSEKEFYSKMLNRYAQYEFNFIREQIEESNTHERRKKLVYFIKKYKNWDNITQAIDYRDSIEVSSYGPYTNNYSRFYFLNKYPKSKYYEQVKKDYIKYYKNGILKNFVIATSNSPNAFIDSIIKHDNKYTFYIQTKDQTEKSIVKEKYFLCTRLCSSSIYSCVDELAEIQKKYPKAFIRVDTKQDGDYLVFSENKIYKDGKLLPVKYEAVILLNPSWLDESPEWAKTFQDSLWRQRNRFLQVQLVSNNFDNVKIDRLGTPFTISIKLNKWAKKYPDGGVVFVKSGKNMKFIKYPACLMMDKLVESGVAYYNKE